MVILPVTQTTPTPCYAEVYAEARIVFKTKLNKLREELRKVHSEFKVSGKDRRGKFYVTVKHPNLRKIQPIPFDYKDIKEIVVKYFPEAYNTSGGALSGGTFRVN